MDAVNAIDSVARQRLESAAFRRLLAHLRARTDVQNIDLMILAGFCRNCLANWYQEAAAAEGVTLSREDARAEIYGMEFAEWKRNYQTEATPEQIKAMKAVSEQHG